MEEMSKPSDAPETFTPKSRHAEHGSDKKTRPERMFERHRFVWAMLLLVGITFLCTFELVNVQNPTQGFQKILGSQAGTAATPRSSQLLDATAAPARQPGIIPNGLIGTPVAGGPSNLGGILPQLLVRCRMNQDAEVDSMLLYRLGLVEVGGYSHANGGLANIVNPRVGWIPASLVTCERDLAGVEQVYFPTRIPTVKSSPFPSVRYQYVPQTVVVSREVVVTATPSYASLAGDAGSYNGVWYDGSCWHFTVWGVRAITVDSSVPVAGGQIRCNISSFNVVVK